MWWYCLTLSERATGETVGVGLRRSYSVKPEVVAWSLNTKLLKEKFTQWPPSQLCSAWSCCECLLLPFFWHDKSFGTVSSSKSLWWVSKALQPSNNPCWRDGLAARHFQLSAWWIPRQQLDGLEYRELLLEMIIIMWQLEMYSNILSFGVGIFLRYAEGCTVCNESEVFNQACSRQRSWICLCKPFQFHPRSRSVCVNSVCTQTQFYFSSYVIKTSMNQSSGAQYAS